MTIRTRFHVIFLIIAALMMALAIGAVSALSLSQSLVERVYRGALLPSLDLKRVADAYTGAAVVTAVRVRIGDLRWEEGEEAVRRAAEQAKPAWERYKANARSETERALMRSAQENMVEANAAIDELVDILAAQDIAGLTAFIARAMYPSVNPLLMDIDRLTAQQDRIGEGTYDDAIAEVKRYWINQTLLLAVAVAMFAAAFYTVRNRVVLPLHRMTGAMSAVAEGELDRPVPSSGRADEIGALARALVRFKDNAARLKEDQRTLRILADELSAARDKAEEATHAKSTFLAMMSHEIRTPMNGVTAMAEMLDRTDLGAEQRDMLGIIRSSGDALLVIINDILDFSKIEAGKLDIETIELALTDLVEGAAELVASRAAEKGLRYAVDLAPDLPDRLLGDPTRVRQILINLLGNAVKFTQSGVILLTVRDATPDGGDGTRRVLRFAVADSGIGLSEEQIQRLFRPFEQADGSTSRRYGGTGLGLSISSALCAMMGGRIGVTSELGRGSTFWFELPFAVVAPEPAAPIVAIADARIIAVGFVDEERAALRDLLMAAGIQQVVMVAYDEDWADAAAGGSEDAPTVLLLHAGGDGAETAQLAAEHLAGATPAPPVLLAMPRPRPTPPLGVFATLPLPLRRRRVWRTLAAALGRAPLDVHDPREASDLDGWEPPSRAEAEAANALILVAEDNPTNQVVIRRMLAQRGYAFDLANHGGEALALLRSGRYGLLLTDFHMPEMDGFELTAAIRAEEAGGDRRLPIVALTADALPGTGQRCQEAGMDAYLTKPIDSKALSATLQRFLPQAAGLRRAVAPVAAQTTDLATDLATRAAGVDPWVFDPTRLIESFGRAEVEALAFLAAFVDAIPGMIAAIENALVAADQRAARDAAHSLKGAALSVGAVRLGQLAGDLQDALDDSDPETAAFLCSLLPPTQDELVAATAALRAPTV
jgi:two-component system, sensor histidine kinase and response regulator